ncbi:MAG TPA: phospholipase D family protein [Symbiobacteriaceae bacterium]|nr:phospholipase D family protein [Symbiobacteriaceae bacterium]
MQVDFVRDLGGALSIDQPLEEMWLCSAYTSARGARSLKKLITASQEKHAILGCNAQTEGRALEVLQEWGVEVQIMPDPPGGIFHPKCLYARKADGQAWVVAGSANMTEGGFRQNIEAGIKVMGPTTLAVVRDARRFFEDMHEAAAPLTPDLLRQFKAVQEEVRAALRQVASATMGAVLGLDASQALLLTPAGRGLIHDVDVLRFHHYIRVTKMEASYKMVILPLLLQAPEGRLEMLDLARMFAGFYRLLVMAGRVPERSPMKMRDVAALPIEQVVKTLKGAPKEALSRPGIAVYQGSGVAINRQIWDAMTEGDREGARGLAVERLAGYYREHLGYVADFSSLLYGAEATDTGTRQ